MDGSACAWDNILSVSQAREIIEDLVAHMDLDDFPFIATIVNEEVNEVEEIHVYKVEVTHEVQKP